MEELALIERTPEGVTLLRGAGAFAADGTAAAGPKATAVHVVSPMRSMRSCAIVHAVR